MVAAGEFHCASDGASAGGGRASAGASAGQGGGAAPRCRRQRPPPGAKHHPTPGASAAVTVVPPPAGLMHAREYLSGYNRSILDVEDNGKYYRWRRWEPLVAAQTAESPATAHVGRAKCGYSYCK